MSKATRGRGKAWTEHETSALLLGIKNHSKLAEIAKFLQRTEAGVLRRLNEHHQAEWHASKHPQCHPHKSEGKARAKAAREAAGLRVVPDPTTEDCDVPPWASSLIAMVSEQASEIAGLRARVEHLEAEWGIKA
jgi:hypothetical protein